MLSKLIKTKLVNSYRAYVRMIDKITKIQHKDLYILTKGLYEDRLCRHKQYSLKKVKLNFSATF